MAGESEEEKKEELLAHFHAYNQIFQAILKKVPGDGAAKKQRLGRLQQYIKTRIKDPDDFINHIPQFAKGLGVKEAALSSYIGSNFLRALTTVKQKLAEQKAQKQAAVEAAAPVAAAAPANASILVEVEHTLGPIVQAPARFELMELGLMKLITDSGEIMPASFGANGSGGASAPAPAPAAAPASSGSAPAADVGTPTADSGGAAPAPTPAPPILTAETPIIKEILDKFGSVLDVQGKLEPSNGLDEVMVPAEPAAGGAPAPVGTLTEAAAPTPGAEAGAAPVMVKKKREPEAPIIQEILDKFGSVLDVHGKLEPSDGLEGGNIGLEISASAAEPELAGPEVGGEAAPPPEETFTPIPMDFQQYINTMKKLQEFQKTPDLYRAWLNGDAGASGKALVGLRNYMLKEKGGAAIHWDDEYYNLAMHVGVKPGALRDLHHRIRGFGEIQQMITRIKSQLSSRDAAFVGAIKKIWPQIILLFNQAEDVDSYNSQFKITLLQVPDAALKEQLSTFMQPIFQELERIYAK